MPRGGAHALRRDTEQPGRIPVRRGDCETAAALYRRSARHTKRFFGENADYGETLQNLRWVYEKMGEHEKALDALADAEKVYLALYGPGHDRTRAVREDLERLAHPDRDTPANA